MGRMGRLAITLACAGSLTACATSLRNPRIAELRDNPGRYQDRSVTINGTVTSSWSVPLVPFRLYNVDDGTGEVTVVAQSSRSLPRGARVRVKGRVEDLGVFGGNALGLHLREQDVDVRRR